MRPAGTLQTEISSIVASLVGLVFHKNIWNTKINVQDH
jgi:hypothetical protein